MDKTNSLKPTILERIYCGAVVFLFISFVMLLGAGGHGQSLLHYIFIAVWIIVFISGLILALMAARDRPAMFVILTVIALLVGFFPYLF